MGRCDWTDGGSDSAQCPPRSNTIGGEGRGRPHGAQRSRCRVTGLEFTAKQTDTRGRSLRPRRLVSTTVKKGKVPQLLLVKAANNVFPTAGFQTKFLHSDKRNFKY